MAPEPTFYRPEEKTLVLNKPIELAGETFSHLDLREPTVAELIKFDSAAEKDGVLKGTLFLISMVTGVPVPALEKLGALNYREVERYLKFFINPVPVTGEGSSPS